MKTSTTILILLSPIFLLMLIDQTAAHHPWAVSGFVGVVFIGWFISCYEGRSSDFARLLKRIGLIIAFPLFFSFFLLVNWSMDQRQRGFLYAVHETWDGIKSIWTK